MVNPVYTLAPINEEPTKLKSTQKHHAKIDTNLRINKLSQEVNMPLLRLVHQLYSIIEDAIDYDKEQNKLLHNNLSVNEYLHLPGETPTDLFNTENTFPAVQKQTSFRNSLNRNSLNRGTRFVSNANRRDVWKFMDDIIENRELVPGQKYSEKDEVTHTKKNKTTSNNADVRIRSQALTKSGDNLVLTLFGRISIKKIKSKAALGTLALYGEMNNIQLSLTFAQKLTGYQQRQYQYASSSSSKHLYEASLNTCVDSTFCNLTKNDTKQDVVQMRIAKCHLFSSLCKLSNVHNSASSFVHIGQINIDVPLRPMLVHGVMYRESKVIEQNILPEIKNFVIFEEDDELMTKNASNEAHTDGPNGSDNGNPIINSANKQTWVI
jgi:hypothetical protein